MEQITYFQGENIVIHAQAFSDNTCAESQSLGGYDVEVLIYTNEQDKVLRGSSTQSLDFDVEVLDDGSLTIEVSSELTCQLEPGFLRMELALKDSDATTVQIAKSSLARIESSLISKIMSDDSQG